MVFGVPFQFSNQFESTLTVMTEEEAAALRATEMFKLAERRDSEASLPSPPHPSRATSVSSATETTHGPSPTRSTRSQSDDMNVYTTSGPLHYEEEALIEHYQQQPLPPPQQQQASYRGETSDVLLTHNEEGDDEGDGDQHHEL
jgi:hypothetical protein